MCGRSVGRSVSDDAAHAIASDTIKKLCLTVGSVPVKSLFWRTSHPVKRVHIPICVGILPLNSLFVSVRPEIILDDRPVKTSTGRSPPILLLATFMVYLKFVQRPISCMCVRQGDDRTMVMMMITNEWANIKSVPSLLITVGMVPVMSLLFTLKFRVSRESLPSSCCIRVRVRVRVKGSSLHRRESFVLPKGE